MAAVRRRMADEVGRCRATLQDELRGCAESVRAELAPWALSLSIGEFLALESVMAGIGLDAVLID